MNPGLVVEQAGQSSHASVSSDVYLSCIGKFHHFDLARQLHERRRLAQVISGYPLWKLKGEGMPVSKIVTIPYVHAPLMLLRRFAGSTQWADVVLSRLVSLLDGLDAPFFDLLTSLHVARLEITGNSVLIGLSGHNFRSGLRFKAGGGTWICDRGSTHARHRRHILIEEYARVGIAPPVGLGCDLEREEREYQASDAIFVPSVFVKGTFLAHGIAAEKIHVIPYGVDLSRFHPVGEPPADELNLLFVGTVGVRKGIHDVLEAFSRIRHSRKKLTICGSLTAEGRQILSRFSHVGAIKVKGPVQQAELNEYYSRSDFLLLPSLEEGLAMVQAQAMACGCPVISTDNAGADEIFEDRFSGMKVPIRRPDEIARRIEEASDLRLGKDMRMKALERIASIRGWNVYGDKVIAAVDQILLNRRH